MRTTLSTSLSSSVGLPSVVRRTDDGVGAGLRREGDVRAAAAQLGAEQLAQAGVDQRDRGAEHAAAVLRLELLVEQPRAWTTMPSSAAGLSARGRCRRRAPRTGRRPPRRARRCRPRARWPRSRPWRRWGGTRAASGTVTEPVTSAEMLVLPPSRPESGSARRGKKSVVRTQPPGAAGTAARSTASMGASAAPRSDGHVAGHVDLEEAGLGGRVDAGLDREVGASAAGSRCRTAAARPQTGSSTTTVLEPSALVRV